MLRSTGTISYAFQANYGKFLFLFAYSESMAGRNERHGVYLFFQFRNGRQCQFLEADLKTSLPRRPVLTDSPTLIGLVERGGGLPDLASRQALDQAIAKGRGGVFLALTPEQYHPPVERVPQFRMTCIVCSLALGGGDTMTVPPPRSAPVSARGHRQAAP